MSDAFLGHGCTLSRGTTSTGPWTAVAETRSITPPQLSRNEVEVTHTTSPDGYREYIGGLKDGSSVDATVNYLPNNATHQQFIDDFENDTEAWYRVQFDDPAGAWNWIFEARVMEIAPPAIDPGDAVQLTVRFKTTRGITSAVAP